MCFISYDVREDFYDFDCCYRLNVGVAPNLLKSNPQCDRIGGGVLR